MTKIVTLGNIAVNNFIIEENDGLILVDSGYLGGFPAFISKFEKLGYKERDIRFLFLTHCHDDHTGFLLELMEYSAAPLILHPAAVERLKAGANPHTHGASYKLMQLYLKANKKEKIFPIVDKPERYLAFDESRQFIEEAGMSGQIVALPGHTADSIGILFPDGRLICGDTAMNIPLCKAMHPLVLESLEDLRNSWDFMINNAKTILTSHGKAFPAEKLIKHRHAMDGKEILKIFD